MKTYLIQFTGFRPSMAILADSLADALSVAVRRYGPDIAAIELI